MHCTSVRREDLAGRKMAALAPSHPFFPVSFFYLFIFFNDCLSRNSTIYRPLIILEEHQERCDALLLFVCAGKNNHHSEHTCGVPLCHFIKLHFCFFFRIGSLLFEVTNTKAGVDSWALLTAGLKSPASRGEILVPSGAETLSGYL